MMIPMDDKKRATKTVSIWLMFSSVFWPCLDPTAAPAAKAPSSSLTPRTPPSEAKEKQKATAKRRVTSALHLLCIQSKTAGMANHERATEIARKRQRDPKSTRKK